MNENINKEDFLKWVSITYHESFLLIQQEYLMEKKFRDADCLYTPTIDEENFFNKLIPPLGSCY